MTTDTTRRTLKTLRERGYEPGKMDRVPVARGVRYYVAQFCAHCHAEIRPGEWCVDSAAGTRTIAHVECEAAHIA